MSASERRRKDRYPAKAVAPHYSGTPSKPNFMSHAEARRRGGNLRNTEDISRFRVAVRAAGLLFVFKNRFHSTWMSGFHAAATAERPSLDSDPFGAPRVRSEPRRMTAKAGSAA